MASERVWVGIPTQLFTSNGGSAGQVSIPSTEGIKVKQHVFVGSNTQPQTPLEVKFVSNETGIILGPIKGPMRGPGSTTDLSLYLSAANAYLRIDEQQRPTINSTDILRAVYEEEPTVALRTFTVDHLGRRYTEDNPFPVQLSNGSVNIGTVNAQLEMFITHKDNDPHPGDVHSSMRLGNGVDELDINSDKEALVHDQDTHDGIALINQKLQSIVEHVDGLEGFTDGIEGLLATIRDNADQVESLLSAVGNNTDGIEGLQTSTNSLLTTIRDNADQVESLLSAVGNNTDGLEALITNTNSLLTTIRDNADTVESLLSAVGSNTDGIEGLQTATNSLLTTIRDNADQLEGYTDGLEALITASNLLLTSIRDNADQLEGYTDGLESLITNTNSLLTTIRDNADQVEALLTAIGNNTDQLEGFVDGVETLLTAIRDNADTVETLIGATNTKLDDLKTEVDTTNYTMNEAFNKAQATAGQLNDVTPTVATEGNVAPFRITPQRAQHINLRNQEGSEVGTNLNRLKVEANFANDYTTTAIGALRVAETQNVFESLFSFDKQSLVWDESLTGGATSTFNANTNSIDLTLPTTSGASAIRQTFRRIRYNPSRTTQVLSAGTLGAGKANVRKRIGQFDSLDGLFLELDGTVAYVVRRTSVSGVAVDVRTPQSDWNIDKFDGTGISGVTIDFSKHNLFYIQYAFQGFGDIVYGFYSNGRVRFCHRESISNILTVPSLRTAHLPCRVEITNTGTAASSTTMSYNSFTIKNEGQDSETEGQIRSYSAAPIKTVGTTTVPVISVRLGPSFQRAVADIIKTTIFVQTVDEVIWSLHLNPVLTGATFAITASYTVLDTAATAMTTGTEVDSGILSQNASSSEISQTILKLLNSNLGSSIANVPTIVTLGARSRLGTADVLSTLVWREYP